MGKKRGRRRVGARVKWSGERGRAGVEERNDRRRRRRQRRVPLFFFFGSRLKPRNPRTSTTPSEQRTPTTVLFSCFEVSKGKRERGER